MSDYFNGLSTESKARYRYKVTVVGLQCQIHIYAIPEEQWVADPCSVPNVVWNDKFLYMVGTPSVYTKE